MARQPTYSVAECEAKIREIDALLSTVLAVPVSSGSDGTYYQNGGRVSDLRNLRADWEARLKDALAFEEDGRPSGQGPTYEVY